MLVKGDMSSLARSGGGCWLGTGLGAHSFPCWEFMFAHVWHPVYSGSNL